MNEQAAYLTSNAAAAGMLVPAVALAGISLLSGAPGEWARGATAVYVGLLAALAAGAALGPSALAVVGVGFLALVVGGPWGAILAGLAAAGAAVALLAGGQASVSPLLAPGLAACALVAGLRGLV